MGPESGFKKRERKEKKQNLFGSQKGLICYKEHKCPTIVIVSQLILLSLDFK
jgi:hypothetical protein